MTKWLKIILLGLLIWVIPFAISLLVWDIEAQQPSIPTEWFNALMAFAWVIGFSIAIWIYSKGISGNQIREAWTAGIVWYFVLIVMDFFVLVLAFNMAAALYYPLLLTYLNTLVLTVVVGYILSKK